jgi:lipid-binding SYLF domain-containing protein
MVVALAGGVTLAPRPAAADDAMEARHLVERAQQTLEDFIHAEEMEGFRTLVKEKGARGLFISPQILKGAFFIGGSGGSGVLIARDTLTGRWTGPAFYTMGSASFGLQIGGQASEVVLVIMTQRGINALMNSSVKLGADIGVAAGPVGMGAAASTANLSADIVSFSRSKGLFGGISVDGAVVKTRNDWNDAYYGKVLTANKIFRKRTVKQQHALSLLQTAAKLSGSGMPLTKEETIKEREDRPGEAPPHNDKE